MQLRNPENCDPAQPVRVDDLERPVSVWDRLTPAQRLGIEAGRLLRRELAISYGMAEIERRLRKVEALKRERDLMASIRRELRRR